MDQKKRQKKLEKQKKKRKVKTNAIKELNNLNSLTISKYPIHECLMTSSIFELGKGTVVVSRKIPQGRIAMSFFLLDLYCLGVKDCFFRISSASEYQSNIADLDENNPLEKITPEYGKKLIVECLAFAKDIGFAPHEDFRKSAPILNGINENDCTEVFEFGSGGEPCYILDPNVSQKEASMIIAKIEAYKNKIKNLSKEVVEKIE